MIPKQPAALIEAVTPLLEGGRYSVKRAAGEDLVVEADVFKDGHDLVTAVLKWRQAGAAVWHETPMMPLVNDRWRATCSLFESATCEYTIAGVEAVCSQPPVEKQSAQSAQNTGVEAAERAPLPQPAGKHPTDRRSSYPRVEVDRERAKFAAWYEFFPRSAEGKADSGSTFRDCLGRIDDAKAMGFDVIYFPPIHPIGATNRKGRNNSVKFWSW